MNIHRMNLDNILVKVVHVALEGIYEDDVVEENVVLNGEEALYEGPYDEEALYEDPCDEEALYVDPYDVELYEERNGEELYEEHDVDRNGEELYEEHDVERSGEELNDVELNGEERGHEDHEEAFFYYFFIFIFY